MQIFQQKYQNLAKSQRKNPEIGPNCPEKINSMEIHLKTGHKSGPKWRKYAENLT